MLMVDVSTDEAAFSMGEKGNCPLKSESVRELIFDCRDGLLFPPPISIISEKKSSMLYS